MKHEKKEHEKGLKGKSHKGGFGKEKAGSFVATPEKGLKGK